MNHPSGSPISNPRSLKRLRSRFRFSILLYAIECAWAFLLFVSHLLRPWRVASRRKVQDFLDSCGHSLRKPSEIVPQCDLDELFPGVAEVELCDAVHVEGNVSMDELYALGVAVRGVGARRIFEIGTFDGRTSLNLIRNAGAEARLWTLDLPLSGLEDLPVPLAAWEDRFVKKTRSGARFLERPERQQIEQLLGNSMTFDFAPYANRFDFVFIDGSHALEYVMKDSETARRLLAERGVIVWHDYGEWPEVTLALNMLLADPSGAWPLRRLRGTSLVFAVFA